MEFEKALNHIIAEQLKNLRKDIGNKVILPKHDNEPIEPKAPAKEDLADEKVL